MISYKTNRRLNQSGLIIIGYQGIGKSSYARVSTNKEAIDLESSLFYLEGNRIQDWETIYCNIAISLANNGYTVFVSSHQSVIDELRHRRSNDDNFSIVIVTPSRDLKDDWIAKLNDRYINDGNEKNYRAYLDAKNNFTEEVDNLTSIKEFSCIQIEFMNYQFNKIVRGLQSMYGAYSTYRPNYQTRYHGSIHDSDSDDDE